MPARRRPPGVRLGLDRRSGPVGSAFLVDVADDILAIDCDSADRVEVVQAPCRSNCCMLCRAKLSSVSQVGLDAATDSVLFFLTGGVSFCSGVDRARGSFGEPKVTPPFLVYTLSDVTSAWRLFISDRIRAHNS